MPLTGAMQTAVAVLQGVLDRRIALRLAIVVAGMLLSDDRRTASAWFVAASIKWSAGNLVDEAPVEQEQEGYHG